MRRNKFITEMPLSEAGERIAAFFHNDPAPMDAFYAVCNHILELDPDLLIRANGRILGVCKPGEFCRFYLVNRSDGCRIKYRNCAEKEAFTPSGVEQYFEQNRSCIAFFADPDNPRLARMRERAAQKAHGAAEQDSSRPVREWEENWHAVRVKAENGLKFPNSLSPDAAYVDGVYGEILELLRAACADRKWIGERDGEIVCARILSPGAATTLQVLGDRYQVSRECIHQRETKTWKKLTEGIYRARQENALPYREGLQRILEGIPDEVFLPTVAGICRRNAAVGLWLQKVIGGVSAFSIRQLAVSGEPPTATADDPERPQGDSEIPLLMRRAARYYYAQLKNDPTARTAIDVLHTWGIEGKNIVRLGFGFHNNATQGLIREMTGSYSVLQLEEANLVRQTEKGRYRDTMRNSIIIPTVDADGRVVCFDSYVIGEQRFCRYPDTGYFRRDQNLYSYNLAVKSGKKSVIVVTTYEDCFRLIGLGFSNVVSTYSPEITPAQLALLGRAFRAVLLMTGARFDAVGCMEYCRENGLSFDRIDWQGYANAAAYAEENAPAIAEKAEEYERG